LRPTAPVGHVLRAREGDVAVDHDDLAVVAQVGAPPHALRRVERQHLLEVQPRLAQPAPRDAALRVADRRPVVVQHPHLHAAVVGALEGVEEREGRLVAREDVELDVHVALGLVDRGRHRLDRLAVVGQQLGRVARAERHGAEGAVELHDAAEPRRLGLDRGGLRVEAGGAVEDALVDLALLLAPVAGQLRRADQAEQQAAGDRRDEDRGQPRHRGARLAVARHRRDRHHPDQDVDDEHHGGECLQHGAPSHGAILSGGA